MSHCLPLALEKIKQSYIDRESRSLQDKARFLQSLHIYNTATKEMINPSFNPEWENKYRELYYINKFNYIHIKAIDNNMIPVFITLTLPSEYHQFKKRGKTFVSNPSYNELLTVTESYQQLNKIFRSLYNNFKVYECGNMVHVSTKFIKVVEPHKDFTPHIHAIVYIPSKYLEEFRKHFKNIVELYSLRQIDYEELNRTLDKKYGSINYLLKYVGKTLGGNAVLSGWRKTHKIRAVTTSNITYSKKHYDLFVKKIGWDKVTSNIFLQMEKELTVKTHYMVVDKSYIGTFKSRDDLLKKLIRDDRFNKYKEITSEEEKYVYIDYRILSVKPKNEFLITFEDEKMYQYEVRYKYDDMFLRHDLTYDTIGEFDSELGLFVPVTETDKFYNYNTEFGDDETIEEYGKSKTKVYSEIVLYQTLSKNVGDGVKIYDKSDYSVKVR